MDNLQNELNELKGFIAELKADRAAAKEKEKRESWTKYVSLTVVIIAVLASFASQWSGGYGSRVQLSQAQASDEWNLYQARSIKGHLLEVTSRQLARTGNTNAPEAQKMLQSWESDIAKYNRGKSESQDKALALEAARDEARNLGRKMGWAVSLFSVSISMAAMCLLTKKKPLWLLGMLLAAVATGLMASVKLSETPPKPPAQASASTSSSPAPPH